MSPSLKTLVRALAALLMVIAAAPVAAQGAAPNFDIERPSDNETVGSEGTTIHYRYYYDDVATIQCSIDGSAFVDCPSATTKTGLAHGSHTLVVRAADIDGNTTEKTRQFNVDIVAPDTTVEAPAMVGKRAVFTFTSTEPGLFSRFRCKFDDEPWSPCQSGNVRDGLTEGRHVVSAVAIDPYGNEDASPAVREFFVDLTAPPGPTITSGPSGFVTDATATFTFTSPEPGAGYRCYLSRPREMAPDMSLLPVTYIYQDVCTSPFTVSGLDGAYEFMVSAHDVSWNPSAPVKQTFFVGTAEQAAAMVVAALGTFSAISTRQLATAGIAGLLKSAPTRLTFSPPGAGVVRVKLTAPKKSGKRPAIVVAKGSASTTVGAVQVPLKVTAAGRKLLRRSKSLRLALKTTFKAAGVPARTTSAVLTAKRKADR
jgi:hypothetical protein